MQILQSSRNFSRHSEIFISHKSASSNANVLFRRISSTKILPQNDSKQKFQEKILEINTKNGKLLVRTSVSDSTIKGVIIEKQSGESQAGKTDGPIITKPGDDSKNLSEKEIIADRNREYAKKRLKPHASDSSVERNFITPSRAITDFLLKPSDLESLSSTKRRSPYENEPPITVYWRKDVEAKAIEIWGTRENLLKECLKREIEKKKHQQNLFTIKKRLKDYRRELGKRTNVPESETGGLLGSSGKVVLCAVGINALNFIFKCGAWLYTGSHSMFAETIHSAADTINQLILAYGIHKSNQLADQDHPYGYSNMRYVSSLISGVGIFCVGTGLSFYHGITGMMHPEPIDDFYWAFFILGGSLVSEGATLVVAVNRILEGAKSANMSFKEYGEF